MSVRTETLQLRVLIDGTPARRELAGLDQEYAKLNSGLKDLKKNSTEWLNSLSRMDTIKTRQADLRKEIGDTALSAKQLGDELKRLQVIQRNSTPNTEQWAANATRIEQLKQRLRELNDVNARAAAAWDVQRRSIKLTDMSMEQLELESRRLKAAMHGINPNTAEFVRYRRELDLVHARQQVLNTGMSSFGRAWQGMKSQIAGGLATVGAYFGVTTLISGLKGLVTGAGELSDELANVQKATGQSAEEVRELNRQLRNIDTRTANTELRNIAIGLGQAGEEASAAAVEAIDKINVALGDEFGEGAKEITTTLTQLRNNLSDIKSGDYGDDVGRIGNALNELGAQGMATAPVVSDIANRVAGTARQFDVSSGSILGLAATFQELGINVERGSTAYVRILQRIAKEPEKFGRVVKAAGLDVDLFNRQVNEDMQAAFVTVAKAARLAGTSNTEFATILQEFGTEGVGVSELLSKIGANQELLADKTKLATEALTNQVSITEEFNIKNQTLGAQIDQLAKSWDSFVAGIVSGQGALSWFLSGAVGSLKLLVDELGKAQSFADVFKLLSNPGTALQLNAQAKAIAALTGAEKSLAEVNRMALEALAKRKEATEREDELMVGFFDQQINALRQRALILRAEARAAAEAQKNLMAGFRGGKGPGAPTPEPDTALTDEEVKAAQEKRKRSMEEMEKLRGELDKIREGIYQDGLSADEREIRQLDVKYAELRANILANTQHTEEDLRALEQAFADERAGLIEAQGQRRIEAAAKAASAVAKAEQDAQDKVFEARLNAEDGEVVKKLQEMDTLLGLAGVEGDERVRIVKSTEEAIARIRQKYRDQEKQAAVEMRRQAIQNQIAIMHGVATALGGLNDFLAATYSAQADNNYKNTVGAKALGLVQIATASAVGVAEAIKAGAGLPWPANLAAIGSGVGAVLGGVASAIALLRDVPKPDTSTTPVGPPPSVQNAPLGRKGMVLDGPSHENDGLKVVNPHTGRVEAELEGGELVLSKLFTNRNKDLVPLLLRMSALGERLPIGKSGGVFGKVAPFNFARATEAIKYAAGGVIGRNNYVRFVRGGGMRTQDDDGAADTGRAGGDNSQMMALLKMIVKNTGGTWAATSRPTRAAVSLRDWNRKLEEDSQLQDKNKVKRLPTSGNSTVRFTRGAG